MTKQRQAEEGVIANQALEADPRAPQEQAWDPLASIQKTISPTQRLQLLKMEVPILPPEDFLDTTELQQERGEPSRRFVPLVLCSASALLILLCAGVWSRFWAPSGTNEGTQLARSKQAPPPTGVNRSAPVTATASSAIVALAPTGFPQPGASLPGHVAESPGAKAPAAPPATARLPKSQPDPKRATVTRSNVAEAAEPNTSTPSTPQIAPSGVVFWTQPR